MRTYLLVTFLSFVGFISTGFGQKPTHIKLAVESTSFEALIELGLTIDHGVRFLAGDSLEIPYSPHDEQVLAKAGMSFRAFNAARETLSGLQERGANGLCRLPTVLNEFTPRNFQYGSMDNGYYTLPEIHEQFAAMRIAFPDLVSEQMEVDSIRTFEGRPMLYYRISDNADVEESEKKVFMNALTHAREPLSVMHEIYFIWWLLENYATDAEAKWLVDNTELYVMPCVNPDGYAFNSQTSELGFWRKNRFDNGDGTFGIDLNRNFVIDFGGVGASSNTDSDIYHGPAPLSEPETQAIDKLLRRYDFEAVMNSHSFSNLVISPSYLRLNNSGPRELNLNLATAMRRDNGYVVGEGLNTVLYSASGSASDHCAFDDSNGRPLTFAVTPETGTRDFGFFPPRDTIDGMCKGMLLTNWRLLQAAHFTAVVDPIDTVFTESGQLRITVRRISRQGGQTELQINSLDPRMIFSQTSFPLDFTTAAVQDIYVDYFIEQGLTDRIDGFELGFVDLPHVKPYASGPFTYYASERVVDLSGDGLSAFSNSILILDGTKPVLGYDQPGSQRQHSIPFQVSSDVEQVVIRYQISHTTAYTDGSVTPYLRQGNRGLEVLCARHFAEGLSFIPEPKYWSESIGYFQEEIKIEDIRSGNYTFSFVMDPNEGYVYIDSVSIDVLRPATLLSSSVSDFSGSTLSLFPNPSSDYLSVSLTGPFTWSVIDISGRVINQGRSTGGVIDISSLGAGVYILSCEDQGRVWRSKFVKR